MKYSYIASYNEVNDKIAKWTSEMQLAEWFEISMCENYGVNDKVAKWNDEVSECSMQKEANVD